MHFVAFMLLASCSIVLGSSLGKAIDTSHVIAKMVQGISDAGIDELSSRVSIHEGREYSYHLKTIDYLGNIVRDGRRYTVTTAKFLRSPAKGSDYPPARAHGFLIIFDDSFRVATYGRMAFQAGLHMDGNVLKSGDGAIADFSTTEPLVRYHGWLLDGSSFMAYPFADKISKQEWESGSFLKKTMKAH